MRLYFTYAVLFIIFLSNTAMYGNFPRQLILTIDAIQEDDICSGTKSRFIVLLKTTLFATDSLAGYELDVSYDTSKVFIDQALKVKTVSNKIPSSNFFFRTKNPGIASVIGFLDYNAGYLSGDSVLVVLTGFWKNPLCTDSTIVKIAEFIPAFELGTEDRPLILNSKCVLHNRKNESSFSTIDLTNSLSIIDSVEHDVRYIDTSFIMKVQLDKYAGNAGIKLFYKQFTSNTLSTSFISIASTQNLEYIFGKDSLELEIRKIENYKTATLDIKISVHQNIIDTLTVSKWLFYTEGIMCDCLIINDTSNLNLALYRKNKIDTIINSTIEDYNQQEMCIDFYDVMGRFIETTCIEKALLQTKRKKALKIGTNLIKYIE